MNDLRIKEILLAEKLVTDIRKEAKLTTSESKYLTDRMLWAMYDFNDLPKSIMKKLRKATKTLKIEYMGRTIE